MTLLRPPCPFDPEVPDQETIANFALMECNNDDMLQYWRLAVETSQFISEVEQQEQRHLGSRWFDVHNAQWAQRSLTELSKIRPNPSLMRRWVAWEVRYEELVRQSPKWRLKGMIEWISETHDCCSWPNRWERVIYEWAMMCGDDIAIPFDDRRGIIDGAYRRRLRHIIEEVGGFLYMCEETFQVVFAPTEQLERVWQHQEHIAAIHRQKPFGFFHDAGRPGVDMRQPTEAERQALKMIRRKAEKRSNWLSKLKIRLANMFD